MATIVDVAKNADVSVATVSRVLHNSNRVSEEKRQRVLNAIKELNYEAPPKTSRKKGKKVILVLCGNIIDELLDGIEYEANELGYEVFFGYTMGQEIVYSSFLRKLVNEKNISGLITIAISSNSTEELIKINKQIPMVQCCDEINLSNACVVSSDDTAAAYDAVTHLINLGKKRIGFFGLDRMQHPFKYSRDRENGYRQALKDAGLPIDESLIKHGDYTTESIEEVSQQFIDMEDRPDALFCVRDVLANIFLNSLHQSEIRVPEDIALVGFGGFESSERCWPSLTTIVQSYYEIGTEAMNLLHARIAGKVTVGRKTFVEHKLAVRDSTVKAPR